jgi:hypothetical protein
VRLRPVLAVVVAVAVALLAPAARAAEPRSAWWHRANAGLLPSFGPPDVGEGQVLVEGVTGEPDGWTAVTAIAFPLEGGVVDAALTLVAASSVPGSAPPLVCALRAGFTPVAGGPWSDVPDAACDRTVAGTVTADGARIVFTGLSPLAAAGELRLLVVPGGPGRFVLAAPGEGALVVTTTPAAEPGPALSLPTPAEEGAASVLPFPTLTPAPGDAGAGLSDAVAAASAPLSSGSGRTFSSFRPPGDDGTSKVLTAIVLAVLLGAFTVMQRGATSRLRPATVRWRSAGAAAPPPAQP